MYPVKFYPIPVLRVWGGHELKGVFEDKCQMEIPKEPVGEYWVLSGHPNGTSVVSNGWLKGQTLVDLTDQYPNEFLGESLQPRFPLLIKFLEASDDLSVQVHPTDEYAQVNENDFGKTEAWYVLAAPEEGKVVYGHRFENSTQLFDAARDGNIQDYLDYQTICNGDTVFVPARTLHALLAGTQVIEVQQTSDVTYRVYDWDRPGSDGKPRELHLDKAADALFHAASPDRDGASSGASSTVPVTVSLERTPELTGSDGCPLQVELLASCAYFSLFKGVVPAGQTARLVRTNAKSPDIVIGAGGSLTLTYQAVTSHLPEETESASSSVPSRESLSVDFGETVLIPTSLPEVELASMTKTEATFLLLRY